MTTPDWNARQAVIRAFNAVKNAFRVLVVNDLTSPVPVYITTGAPVAPDTTPTIFNVACPIAGIEYSQALPTGTKKFLLRARKHSKLSFAYLPAQTNVLTIESGVSFEDSNTYQTRTLYFKCSKADEVVEVVAYV